MLVHHCDLCDRPINHKDEYVKQIYVHEDVNSIKSDKYELCEKCYDKICNFINDNKEDFINDK